MKLGGRFGSDVLICVPVSEGADVVGSMDGSNDEGDKVVDGVVDGATVGKTAVGDVAGATGGATAGEGAATGEVIPGNPLPSNPFRPFEGAHPIPPPPLMITIGGGGGDGMMTVVVDGIMNGKNGHDVDGLGDGTPSPVPGEDAIVSQ